MYDKSTPEPIALPTRPPSIDDEVAQQRVSTVTPHPAFPTSIDFAWQGFGFTDIPAILPYVDPDRGTNTGRVDATITSALTKFRGNMRYTGRRRRLRG